MIRPPVRFAKDQNLGILFPLVTLKPIQDYHERVGRGEAKPDGESPVSGCLAHEVEPLPAVCEPLGLLIEEIDQSGDLLVGLELTKRSTPGVRLHLWREPRNSFDESEGYLGEMWVAQTPKGVQAMIEFLQWARVTYRPSASVTIEEPSVTVGCGVAI